MMSTRDPPQTQGYIQTKSEGLEKDISPKWRPKEAGVATLISGKTEIKATKIYKEGYYITIKGSIQEKGITL